MAKLLTFIFLVFSLVEFGQKEVSFNIRNFKLPNQGEVQYIGLSKGNYICQKSDGSFFLIDTLSGAVISDKNDSLKRIYRKYFTSVKDREKKRILFEDKRYQVTGSCSGEWGGTVYFTDKSNFNTYECEATCPLVVNKIETSYYVTSSLAHVSGLTKIIKIEDPAKMMLHDDGNPSESKKGDINEFESRSKQGTTVLIDTGRVLTISSFVYKNNLYHLVTDYQQTYLCRIVHKRFVVMDTFSEKGIWSYEPRSWISEGHLIVRFQSDEADGFLDQYENSIKVYLFDKL
jgi:hypothetical protein